MVGIRRRVGQGHPLRAGIDTGDARRRHGGELVLRLEILGMPANGVLEELLPARGPALRDLPFDDAPEVVG